MTEPALLDHPVADLAAENRRLVAQLAALEPIRMLVREIAEYDGPLNGHIAGVSQGKARTLLGILQLHPDTPHPVGIRIRFLKEISQGPTGDTPAFLFAPKGSLGEIVDYDSNPATGRHGYLVKWDGWSKASFHASGDEFEVLPTPT